PCRQHPRSPPFPYTTLFRSLTSHNSAAMTTSCVSSLVGLSLPRKKKRPETPSSSGTDATSTTVRAAVSGFLKIGRRFMIRGATRSEEHTSELQSRFDLVCRL